MRTDSIENNLVQLYSAVAEMGNYPIMEFYPFRCVSQHALAWPDMAFIAEGVESIEKPAIQQLVQLIRTANWSRTLILGERFLSTDLQSDLKSAGFLPVAQWTNMSLSSAQHLQDRNTPASPTTGIHITEVSNSKGLADWMSIVSNVLFNDKHLAQDIFLSGIEKGALIPLTAYYNGNPASTAMIFKGHTAGIYMVATGAQYRRLGIARSLMRFAEDIVFKAGYEEFFLHSTKDGLAFYRSLGYIPADRMILYYLKK